MGHAPCPICIKANSGFSLLEMLIVMVLIGIVAGSAVLSISGTGQRQLEEEAKRLQQALQLVADEAVYEGTEMGVALTPGSYGFLRYDAQRRQWDMFDSRNLRSYTLPDGLQLSLTMEREVVKLDVEGNVKPSLIFLSTGEMTPFALLLTSEGEDDSRMVTGDGVSAIALREGSSR